MPREIALPDSLPAEVRDWLAQIAAALAESLGDDLRSLILFGSAAEGRMRPSSDVNLMILLRRFDRSGIDAVRGLLQNAAVAIELHPMFLLADELSLAAECFAEKFEDIANRRQVVLGDDPFTDLRIPRPVLLQRLRQVLMNLTLRLRTAYAAGPMNGDALAGVVADTAAPLRRSAALVLELRGATVGSPKAALETVAAELGGRWAGVLERLSGVRQNPSLDPAEARSLILELSALAESMQRLAATLA